MIWNRVAASLIAVGAPVGADTAPAAKSLWTISSRDCVSVHADGEPWDECGFQAFAMNDAGTRVLTVSATGVIQLWDASGRELRRIDWPDQPSGASGYPTGRAIVSGGIGVAITHQNQIAVMDLAEGKILSQNVVEDMMLIDELRFVGDRLFARGKDREWSLGVREIALPSGEIRGVPGTTGWTTLESLGAKLWLTGEKAPFAVHQSQPQGVPAAHIWTCTPFAEHFCFRRDLKGRYLHSVDLRRGGAGRSIDVGRVLTEFDSAYFAVAAGRPFAALCERSPGYGKPRRCRLYDLESGRSIHQFRSDNLRVVGATDEQGRPEVRLAIYIEPSQREDRRVAQDGTMRVIDPKGLAALWAPGGGLVLPIDRGSSLFVDAAGRAVARLPFPAQRCGNGWPDWSSFCRFSADGRRWLVPVQEPPSTSAEREEKRVGLTLYELPALPQ